MNKFLKLFTSLSLIFSFLLLIPGKCLASEQLSDPEIPNQNEIKIYVTNNETGKTKSFNIDDIKINEKNKSNKSQNKVKVNSIEDNNESLQTGYEVFIPIEIEDNSNSTGITPLTIGGGYASEIGISASLYVDYDVSSNNEQVRLNKVYGSWSPSSSMYYLSNRVVGAHSGTGTGKKLTKYPTSNSFSYTTGWGYNNRYWGNASPRAWSEAIVHVVGMTSTYKVVIEFPYS